MEIAAASLSAEEGYKLMTGAIVPRPIAWITTRSPNGRVNAAPFSAFMLVCPKPPMVGIGFGRRAGVLKDTPRNIFGTKEFVVNIADETLLGPLHHSSEELPPEESEVERLGLRTAPCRMIATPRLADAPISMECRFHSEHEFGDTRALVVVGEVVHFHVRDGLCVNNKIDTKALNPICRLGGPNYARLGEIVTMPTVGRTEQMVIFPKT
jgi:flavin reductase (DIM6/NTAB) family NADH-FMN oxidoreductase RutF